MKLTIDVEYGADQASALSDAIAIVRAAGNPARIHDLLEWESRGERFDAAEQILTELEFELADKFKHGLGIEVERLSGKDSTIIEKIVKSACAARRLGCDLQSNSRPATKMTIFHGAPKPMPWWANLPGGALTDALADDFGLEISTAYDERMTDWLRTLSKTLSVVLDVDYENNLCLMFEE